MRPCFKFTAKAGNTPAILAIDDEIGFWGVQARDFRAALDSVEGDALDVHINSVGGDVFAGLGMYNMLRSFAAKGKQITVRVDGLAASIATVVALAGDKRVMPANTFAMMHGTQGGIVGDEQDVRDYADAMAKVNTTMRNIYMERMGIDEAKAIELTAKDNYLTAQECLDLGFATELSEPVTVSAKFDLERAALPENVAAVFKAKGEPPAQPPAAEPPAQEPAAEPAAQAPAAEQDVPVPDTPVAEAIVAAAATYGLQAHANVFALRCDSVAAAVIQMKAAREIQALCKVAGQDAMVASAIRAGKSVADVRKELVAALVDADVHVDTANPNIGKTSGHPASPATVSPTALWDSHNQQLKKGR